MTSGQQATITAAAGTIPVNVKNPGGTGLFGHKSGPNRNRVTFNVQ